MRTVTDIQDRIRGLLFEELKSRVAYAEKRLPVRCSFNHRHQLDSRLTTIEGEPNEARNRITQALGEPVAQTIGLCMYGAENPEEWPGNLCEDAIDAQRCPFFKPHQSKTEIWQEFARQLEDMDWVKASMPQVYALLWVLDESVTFFHDQRFPWWMRLWWRLLRIRLEPVRANVDLTHYLPETTEGSDGVHRP